MAKPRIKWNRRAFAEIRTMPAVMDEVDAIASRLAEQAGDGYEAKPAAETGGRVRGRAVVLTTTGEAMVDEARNHTLESLL